MPKKATAKRPDAGAPCPIMHSCGGCAWLGLPYRKQLARKHTAMRELFEPLIAQFDWDAQIEPVLGMGSSRESGSKSSRMAVCLRASCLR